MAFLAYPIELVSSSGSLRAAHHNAWIYVSSWVVNEVPSSIKSKAKNIEREKLLKYI